MPPYSKPAGRNSSAHFRSFPAIERELAPTAAEYDERIRTITLYIDEAD